MWEAKQASLRLSHTCTNIQCFHFLLFHYKNFIDYLTFNFYVVPMTYLYFIDTLIFSSIFCFIYIKFCKISHCTKIQLGYVASGVCLHLVSAYISLNKSHVKIWAIYNARCCQVDRAAGLQVYQHIKMLLIGHVESYNNITTSLYFGLTHSPIAHTMEQRYATY